MTLPSDPNHDEGASLLVAGKQKKMQKPKTPSRSSSFGMFSSSSSGNINSKKHNWKMCFIGWALGTLLQYFFLILYFAYIGAAASGLVIAPTSIAKISGDNSKCATTSGMEIVHDTKAAANTNATTGNQFDYNAYLAANLTYGHVHMAKTGGTTLNGEMAARFERVCGHKGYSYDFAKHNQRVDKKEAQLKEQGKQKMGVYHHRIKDTMGGNDADRGRVPPSIMDEIGYHDCDYVSIEWPGWKSWPEQVLPQMAGQKLELHVPCRDPIEHLLSQTHYLQKDFDCTLSTDAEYEEHIDQRMVEMNRFHQDLTTMEKVDLKCFQYNRFEDYYFKYMEPRLEPRRIQPKYVYRTSDSGLPRNKDQECLLHASEEFQERIKRLLLKNYPYYRFCEECMGSSKELFPSTKH